MAANILSLVGVLGLLLKKKKIWHVIRSFIYCI